MTNRTVAAALPAAHTVLAVKPTDSALVAAVQMSEAKCGSALVVKDAVVVGIITERDLLVKVIAKQLDAGKTLVASVMTKDPVCVRPDMPVAQALFKMNEFGFRHLPVVGADGIPLGVFSIRDALPEDIAGAEELASRAEYIAANIR